MQHLDGRRPKGSPAQWTDITFVTKPKLSLAMRINSWKPLTREQACMFDDGQHPPFLSVRSRQGRGAQQSFQLVKLMCELSDSWIFRLPSYYVYESKLPSVELGMRKQRILVRTTLATAIIEGHATWLEDLDNDMLAIKLNQTFPSEHELGVLALHNSATVAILVEQIRTVFKYNSGCQIHLKAGDGLVIRHLRKRAAYCFPKLHLPIRKRQLLELTDGNDGPKQPRLRRSIRQHDPFAVVTNDDEVRTLD